MEYIPRNEDVVSRNLRRSATIVISGPLGIGKTRLLQHCHRIIENEPNTEVAYINLKDTIARALKSHIPGSSEGEIENEAICYILEAFANQLSALRTLDSLQKRSNLTLSIASNSSVQKIFLQAGEQVFTLAFDMLVESFKPLPLIELLLRNTGNLTSEKTDLLISEFLKLATRRKKEQDILLLNKPVIPLTEEFIQDIYDSKHHIIILLDDLKSEWQTLNNWLRNLIESLNDRAHITWFLASWLNFIEGNQPNVDMDFTSIELERFKTEELAPWLSNQAWETLRHFPINDPAWFGTYTSLGPISNKIKCEKTGRINDKSVSFLPLLIDKAQTSTDRTCCETLVEYLRDWLADDGLFENIRHLAAARYFDHSLEKYLLGTESSQKWEYMLIKGENRFIKAKGVYWYLDSEIRYALLRYTQIRYSMQDYYALHDSLMAFYEAQLTLGKEDQEPENISFSDIFSQYEIGVRHLLNCVGKSHPRYREILTYQQRLFENIRDRRHYGRSDDFQTKRTEIIERLNNLTLDELEISFMELCNRKKTVNGVSFSTLAIISKMPFNSYQQLSFTEWFYHALSTYRDPGPILLTGIQYALLEGFNENAVSPLVDAIYQVADERHEEPKFLTKDVTLWYLPTEQIGRKSRSNKPYKKEFRKWGELLEECVLEFTKLPEVNWSSIQTIFEAIVELANLDTRCVNPIVEAEATYCLAISVYETRQGKKSEYDYLRDILNKSRKFKDPWWQEMRNLVQKGLDQLDKTDKWDWWEEL